MLDFNKLQFQQTLNEMGFKENEIMPYQELIVSEINYVKNFLFYLNDIEINSLIFTYDKKGFLSVEGETSQESLRHIYNSLKRLRKGQLEFLAALYKGDPQLWQNALRVLYEHYINYITLTHRVLIPRQIDEELKKMQPHKVKQGYQQVASLSAILIAPVQRIPRYILLGKELQKCIHKKNGIMIDFDKKLTAFINTATDLSQKINQETLQLDQIYVRQKLKRLSINHRSHFSLALELLGDLQVLNQDAAKNVMDKFDFSACVLQDYESIKQALAVQANIKFAPLLQNKITEDKILHCIKKMIEYEQRKGKSADAFKQNILIYLSQSLYNQRALGIPFNLIQALLETYKMLITKGGSLEHFIEFISNGLLGNINLIFNENHIPNLTVMDLHHAFVPDMERSSSPYIDPSWDDFSLEREPHEFTPHFSLHNQSIASIAPASPRLPSSQRRNKHNN